MTKGTKLSRHQLETINMPAPEVFVSRTAELLKLDQLLDNVFEKQGRFVIINGDNGLGKTTLVKKFKSRVEERGGRFILTRFEENLKFAPYRPFTNLVTKLDELHKSDLYRSLKIGEADAAVDDGRLNLEAMHTISNRHFIIQQRIVSSLIKYAKSVPLVVALEDIHIASKTVWQFIHFLSDKIADQKILLIATLRQSGQERKAGEVPVYSDIIQRMNRDGLVEKIQLQRLPEKDVREYLRKQFLKTDFSNDFLPNLYEISAGIPAQLVKYLSVLIERKQVYQQNNVWFNSLDIDWENLISTTLIDNNIKEKLEQVKGLSPEMQNLLNQAAFLQGVFKVELISTVNAGTRMNTLKILHRLESQKYLMALDDGSYQFKDIEMRTALREQIPAEQKAKIHLQIADRIEQSGDIDSDEKIYHLAYHYGLTENHTAAFNYITRAAEQAIRNFAFSEARSLHQKALALDIPVSSESEKMRIVQFHLEAAWLDRTLGYYDSSLEHSHRAEELYGDNANDKIGSLIRIEQSFTYFRLNKWEKAKNILEKCLTFEDKSSDFENSMAYYGLGNINFELCNYEEARRYYNRALELAGKIHSDSLIALILNNLGAIENVSGNYLQAIANYSKAIPIYDHIDNKSGLARVYNNIGMTYGDMQDWQQANRFYGMSLSVSDVMGLLPLKSVTFLNRALALAQLNELDQAREYSFKASRLLTQLNDELGMAEYHKIRAVIYIKETNWSQAEKHFETAFQKFSEHNNKLGCGEIFYERAIMAATLQQKDRALDYLKQACDVFAGMGLHKKVRGIEKQIKKLQADELHLQTV